MERLQGCADTTAALPSLIAAKRAEIASRVEGLRALDARLADLETHLAASRPRRELTVLAAPEQAGRCCDAADLVVGTAEGTCSCCSNPIN